MRRGARLASRLGPDFPVARSNLAPRSSSTFATSSASASVHPLLLEASQRMIGSPRSSVALTSAPASSSWRVTSTWHFEIATMRLVLPEAAKAAAELASAAAQKRCAMTLMDAPGSFLCVAPPR